MKMLLNAILATACVAALAGCGSGETKTDAPAPKPVVEEKAEAAPVPEAVPAAEEAMPEDNGGHSDPVNLGTQTVGVYTIEVVAYGGIVAGDEEADVDVDIDGGTPAAVRAWVGAEDAVGAVKALAEEEEPGHYHVHVVVGETLPEGAKLWIELEGDGGALELASFAF